MHLLPLSPILEPEDLTRRVYKARIAAPQAKSMPCRHNGDAKASRGAPRSSDVVRICNLRNDPGRCDCPEGPGWYPRRLELHLHRFEAARERMMPSKSEQNGERTAVSGRTGRPPFARECRRPRIRRFADRTSRRTYIHHCDHLPR